MKVRDLLNALDTLTAGRTQNLDLDVLVRANLAEPEERDDLLIASDITLRIEETCADEDTLFIDVTDDEEQAGEALGDAVRSVFDTIPAPPPIRHLRVVGSEDE